MRDCFFPHKSGTELKIKKAKFALILKPKTTVTGVISFEWQLKQNLKKKKKKKL